MSKFFPKQIIITILGIGLLCVGLYFFTHSKKEPVIQPIEVATEIHAPVATTTESSVIGKSVEGRVIEAYTFGSGKENLLFVGGMHGGYEWNSVLLAYTFIDYLKQNPTVIPENLKITVIPSANPDGVFKVIGKEGRFALADIPTTTLPVGTGRFNANNVDLNRNFDCKWKPESMWRGNVVSAGTSAFSEPETATLRDFIQNHTPIVGVVFWHSQSNAVYASECEHGILPQTLSIMNAYAKVSGYPAVSAFNAYPITGDAEGWLASINIPAITVELKTHETIEWEKNIAGVTALFKYYKASTTIAK